MNLAQLVGTSEGNLRELNSVGRDICAGAQV
jgi:hypothetical protein